MPIIIMTMSFCYFEFEGKLYLKTEYIAYTTPSTKKEYGCGDHAHGGNRVLVELCENGEKVKLTSFPASGN